jgi:hypothetical protein
MVRRRRSCGPVWSGLRVLVFELQHFPDFLSLELEGRSL